MEKNIISTATINNWARLGVDAEDINNKLSKRANKRCSVKNIIPLEYFSDKKNMILLDRIISYVKENNCNIRSIIYTLAIKFLINTGLVELDSKYKIISRNKYLGTILEEYGTSIDKILLNMEYPLQERDFLGLVYQSLLKEGTKNVKGAYYTPEIILDFIKDKYEMILCILILAVEPEVFCLRLQKKLLTLKICTVVILMKMLVLFLK